MPTTYRECEENVKDQADDLIRLYYPDLSDVDIKYLFHVHSEASPLKNKGYAVPAKTKIHSLADRVAGSPDATVVIDEHFWNNHDTLQCAAALDSVLCELMTGADEQGKIITDDAHRPKLKRRPADFFVAGYDDVARRHGMSSQEVIAVAEASKRFKQLGLFSGNDMEPVAV